MRKNKPNSLIKEKSPYLLQHAYNPVDWHAWNDDTLALAKELDKPIFLSIGYSTCYWCHVMERECFEDEGIAKMMNDTFVNVKVDREERPDLDRVYMTILQSITGAGGWPMSLFLTPDLKPFYAATYIPPKAKYGRSGMEDVIAQIDRLWKSDKDKVLDSSLKIFATLYNNEEASDSVLDDSVFEKVIEQADRIFDYDNGGFGGGNKFPRPALIEFLLTHYYRTKDKRALDMVTFTLKKMCDGGIFDNLDYGFHRYSVDEQWRVPHFEKMLYDQAQIASVMFDVFSITGKRIFLDAGEKTLEYVKNFLVDKDGGFYSAEDAESAVSPDTPDVKEEGFFYLWEKSELDRILGAEKSKVFCHHFGVLHKGNTINDPHEIFGTRNVLYRAADIFDTAKKFEMTPERAEEIIDESAALVKAARDKRARPFLDKKIITSWNALMISAFVKGYSVTGKHEYKTLAVRAVSYLIYNLYNEKENKLFHVSIGGEVKHEADLTDYAFVIKALLDFHNTSFSGKLLKLARKLFDDAAEKFYDKENGGFFDSPAGRKDIIFRTKDIYDGAEPSGNSIMTDNAVRLYVIFKDDGFRDIAEKSFNFFADKIRDVPFSFPRMLCSYYNLKYFTTGIILTGDLRDKSFSELHEAVSKRFLPLKCLIHYDNVSVKILPYLKDIVRNGDDNGVYVCENFTCRLPVSKIEELENVFK
ncbi:MAG: thioredoxin domain-containing protein [Bacteroidetes bacterium]|nr:thioredoxin domain-containing protein [Bacteroidota bacterium]